MVLRYDTDNGGKLSAEERILLEKLGGLWRFLGILGDESRAHLSLNRNSPRPREIEPPDAGEVTAKSILGGLHHRYQRAG